MRRKLDPQMPLEFTQATTKTTREYHEKYERISEVLDSTPEILTLLHEDLKKPLKYARAAGQSGRSCDFTTDNVLRIVLVMTLESMSLRRTVVLIDDSDFLRRFTRINDQGMMDYSTLDKLKNSIRPETWKRVNSALATFACKEARISGDRLRVDKADFTTDNVLRIVLVMTLESMSLRRTVVLIDDSDFLRRFTRINDQGMMDYSTLDKLKNSIRPETWKRVNSALATFACKEERISGDRLRVDTTAVETNVHYPTDSALLWDCYRVLARLIAQARELDPVVVGDRLDSGRWSPRQRPTIT